MHAITNKPYKRYAQTDILTLCTMDLTRRCRYILLAAGVVWRHCGAGQAFHIFALSFPAFMQLYPLNLTLLSVTVLSRLFVPFPTAQDRGIFGRWGNADKKITVERNWLVYGALLQSSAHTLFLHMVPDWVASRFHWGRFRLFSNRVDGQPIS